MNPNDERDRGKLQKAIAHSRARLRPFRQNNVQLIKDYVGSAYDQSDESEKRLRTYVNLMLFAADIWTQSLAASNPRFTVTPDDQSLSPFATQFGLTLNNLVKEIHFNRTNQLIVLDAIFTLGIGKILRADTVQLQVEDNVWIDPGQPYFARVSIHNWVHDMTATEWPRCQFFAEEYSFPYWKLRDGNLFDQKVARHQKPTYRDDQLNRRQSEETAQDITREEDGDCETPEEMFDAVDVYLPFDGLVVTYPADFNSKPLAVRTAEGPEGGPYEFLTFADVPDNTMPVSPAQNIKNLNGLANRIWRKMSAQIGRQKTNLLFEDGAGDDAARQVKAVDGEAVRISRKDAFAVVKWGGLEPVTQQAGLEVERQVSRLGGNLEAWGGIGPQADTATQEQLIHAQVSKREQKMQTRTAEFASAVGLKLGWLLWVDELYQRQLQIPIEGAEGLAAPFEWTPEQREGDFFQYSFRVEPFDMAYQPPSQKLNLINNTLSTAAPFLPLIQQQGGMIDLPKYFELVASLSNEPRIKELIKFQMPYPYAGAGLTPPTETKQSPVTTRTNVRKNVPTAGTESSRRHVMQQSLMDSGQVNDDQAASIQRY